MDFVKTNYIWFLIIAIVMVLSLLGYIIENDKKKNPKKYEKLEVKEKKPKKDPNNPLNDLKPGMKLNEVIEKNNKSETNDKVEVKTESVENTTPDAASEVLIIDEPK